MLRIEYVDPQTLVAAGYNPRAIEPENRERLLAGLREFGFVEPIVVRRSDMLVIGGHQRLDIALQERELFPQVPVVFVDDLSDERAKALNILLNNPQAQGRFVDEALAGLLAELDDVGLARFTGFPDTDIDALISGVRDVEVTPGAPPPVTHDEDDDVDLTPPEVPASRAGEVYVLGRHRVMCGDATDPEHVARLLDGAVPRLMVTDPPYGVEYDPAWRAEAGVSNGGRQGTVDNDDRADWREAWALFPGAVAYVYHAGVYSDIVKQSLEAAGFRVRSQIVWVKPRFALSRGHYHWQHEPIWYADRHDVAEYAVRNGQTSGWQGDRSQSTVWRPIIQHPDEMTSAWEIGRDRDTEVDAEHSTQKPLECMERPIRHHQGDVYEPFGGTGTTLIGAERQGRRCYVMELNPAYCDVIRRRYAQFVGDDSLLPQGESEGSEAEPAAPRRGGVVAW